MKSIITVCKKVNDKENEFFRKMEQKTGVPALYWAWMTGTMIGLTIRAIICKIGGYDFWWSFGFKKLEKK